MLYPIKVLDIELSNSIIDIISLEGYMGVRALVRLYGAPIGYIDLPVTANELKAKTIAREIIDKLNHALVERLLENGLASSHKLEDLTIDNLFDIPPASSNVRLPFVTVAVCTRDRTADLALCLDSFRRIDYPNVEFLVIDNAPATEGTRQLLETSYPEIRYIREENPGLDWARNRAALEAKGDIIAYTDDDVVVDPQWVKSIAVLFAENADVMAVTGLVVPYELETEAQVLFEAYGGFGRGFQRKWNRHNSKKLTWGVLGTGQHGTGANMAYRRSIFNEIGFFDTALDVGTVTNGGGDLEMFFRVIKEGHTLVYEPSAIVRHRHRRDYASLKTQLTNNSKGLIAYFQRSIKAYPEERRNFYKLWFWCVRKWNLKRLLRSYVHPILFPRELIEAELNGCFKDFDLYKKARKRADELLKKSGYQSESEIYSVTPSVRSVPPTDRKPGIGIRTFDLSKEFNIVSGIEAYEKIRFFLNWNGLPLGSVDIQNNYAALSKSRFIEKIIATLGQKIFECFTNLPPKLQLADNISALAKRYILPVKESNTPLFLSPEVSVSVVVATYDRPDDLFKCLDTLVKQEVNRRMEIIVVDNNPSSGITPPIVKQFPSVILISEIKKGLSYARNAGITASMGEIILSTDDDVTVPPDWVERLVAPFARPDVMVVTGNVLPVELATQSQQLFEKYGGLGKGNQRIEAGYKWYSSFYWRAVPTWGLGACANAAFRTSIFSHPEIGMINEKLGAGAPTGCSEDTYVFYKVLKLGYTILYEPKAYVWHNHRTNSKSLNHQIYSYSKGHVAYHLETWLKDNDWRGFLRVFVDMPKGQLKKLISSMRGRNGFSPSFVLNEIAGNFAGPYALYRAGRRVKKLGKSKPYVPQSQQLNSATLSELDHVIP